MEFTEEERETTRKFKTFCSTDPVVNYVSKHSLRLHPTQKKLIEVCHPPPPFNSDPYKILVFSQHQEQYSLTRIKIIYQDHIRFDKIISSGPVDKIAFHKLCITLTMDYFTYMSLCRHTNQGGKPVTDYTVQGSRNAQLHVKE